MKKRKNLWIVRWLSFLSLIIIGIAVYKLFDSLPNIYRGVEKIFSLLTPFFIGFLIAFFLNRPKNFFEKKFSSAKWKFLRKTARLWSMVLSYLIFLLIIVFLIGAVIPMIGTGIIDFANQLPDYLNQIPSLVEKIQKDYPLISKIIPWDNLDTSSVVKKLVDYTKLLDSDNINKYFQGVASVSGAILDGFIGFIVSIYILLEKKNLRSLFARFLRLFLKENSVQIVRKYVEESCTIVFRYFAGQLSDALIVAVLAAIALTCMRVPYGTVLGILLGLFNLIPYFGSLIMGILISLLTLLSSGFFPALWVAVAILVIQQVDGNIINPKILGNALDISPFWVIFAITVGGGLFGFLGMLFSVPIFAVIRNLVMDMVAVREYRLTHKGTEEADDIYTILFAKKTDKSQKKK